MALDDFPTTTYKDDVDFNDLPEQMGGWGPPPQPGAYRFRLSKLGPAQFEKIDDQKYGIRVRMKCDKDAPLTIVQASTDPNLVGDPFTTQLTNVPRRRGKGEDAPVASDVDYLLKACKVTERPVSPRAYVELLQKLSNQATEFSADIEWGWSCNDKRDAMWVQDDGSLAGGVGPDGNALKGCGTRKYQKDVPKVDGKFPERITCANCGASVRAFPNLTRFRE